MSEPGSPATGAGETAPVAAGGPSSPAGGDEPSSPWVGYTEGLAAGELRFQRCGACDRAVFYPRVLCPFCGGTELAWETAAGEGTVYATTAMPRREGAARNVCLVDLDEGFRMMSRVDGLAAEEVAIGDRVRLAVVAGEDGPVPAFRPLPGDGGEAAAEAAG